MKFKMWHVANGVVAICVMFITATLPNTTSTHPSIRLHSSIAEMIATSPMSQISVIVQKADSSHAAEELAVKLGGTITQDLSIINAFAVEMSANAAERLAASSSVRWVSLDAQTTESSCDDCIATENLASDYINVVHADKVWNQSPSLQGQGVTVAVVDSGIRNNHPDLTGRIVAQMNVSRTLTTEDFFGHGTYVAGVIAGNGSASNGAYIGIAPKANLVNVKVSNYFGAARESDVIAGLQWIYEHRKEYNIRVVNLSINSTAHQSYHTSPLAAACEILWFNGVVVVVSSGNHGEGAIYPPANDPFVITVGATDTKASKSIEDDEVALFSAFGNIDKGISKPDLVAPGRNIVALNAGKLTNFALSHPANVIDKSYFLMSGTSAAAPIVSGAVALLLQDEPTLTPDQVKYRLKATANKGWELYDRLKADAGILDIEAAIHGTTVASANTGIPVSNLLTTGSEGVLSPSVSWNSVSWNSVSWNSVSWNSVSWNSVSWNSVSWNSDFWESDEVLTRAKLSLPLPQLVDPTEEQQATGTESDKLYLPLISSK